MSSPSGKRSSEGRKREVVGVPGSPVGRTRAQTRAVRDALRKPVSAGPSPTEAQLKVATVGFKGSSPRVSPAERVRLPQLEKQPLVGRSRSKSFRLTDSVPPRRAQPIRVVSENDIPSPSSLPVASPLSKRSSPIPSISSPPRLTYLEVVKSAPTAAAQSVPPVAGQEPKLSPPTVPSKPAKDDVVKPIATEGKGPAPDPVGAAGVGSAVSEAAAVSVGTTTETNRAIRDDMIENVRAILEGLSFEDRCSIVQVAPHLSGRCVETAAGPGGAIVVVGPHRGKRTTEKSGRGSRRTEAVFQSSDEKFARALQKEEQEAAARVAAAVAEDEKLAWSLSASDSPALSRADSLSPRCPTTPPSPPSPSARETRPALSSPNPFDLLRPPARSFTRTRRRLCS